MQLKKAEREKIGSTVYRVSVYFPEEETETLEEKILRLVKNDLIFSEKHGTIRVPQAHGGRQGEFALRSISWL